jgi:hypothetical protein
MSGAHLSGVSFTSLGHQMAGLSTLMTEGKVVLGEFSPHFRMVSGSKDMSIFFLTLI